MCYHFLLMSHQIYVSPGRRALRAHRGAQTQAHTDHRLQAHPKWYRDRYKGRAQQRVRVQRPRERAESSAGSPPMPGVGRVRLAPLRAPLSLTLAEEGLVEGLPEARSRPWRAATSWSQMTCLLQRIADNIVREQQEVIWGMTGARGACDHGCAARAHLESHVARLRSWETLSGAKLGPAGAAIASPSCPASATSTATHGGTISAMAKLAPEGLSAMVIGHVPPWCQRPSAQGSAGEWRSAKSVKRQLRMTNWIGVEVKRRSCGGPGSGRRPPSASANLVIDS